MLLSGPAGSGKTMYCRQFIMDGLRDGNPCLFISSNLDLHQFEDLFAGLKLSPKAHIKFINPCDGSVSKKTAQSRLLHSLQEVEQFLKETSDFTQNAQHNSSRIVVDSLTHFRLLCGEKLVTKFVMDLSAFQRSTSAMILCTLAESDKRLRNTLSVLASGILETGIDDGPNGSLIRKIRMLSLKGSHHDPLWIGFRIAGDGELFFANQPSPLMDVPCTLCGRIIAGTPIQQSELLFDSPDCATTFKKLVRAYGSDITETGLPSGAFTASFFFTDIVALSDPSHSVGKQIQKIAALNNLISSCDALKTAKDKRIILPTGDGMAIGFILNPDLPLELSIELHKKLRHYNRTKSQDDHLGIRIGLASGSVFEVTDLNNTRNIWGPGIILARRVMDAGDDGHILLTDKLAEELAALKDEYRAVIRPIGGLFDIKHGQKMRLYSAYSTEFGNSNLPAKIARTS